jgi:methionine sulfoxide reductase heme-binding subunit
MFGTLKKILIIFALIGGFALHGEPVRATVQDSDADGLTDQAEKDIYLTDPFNPDTDSDGTGDGEEVLASTNPLFQETPASLSREDIGKTSLPWLIGRGSGILAFILLTIVVINGLLMTTRLVFHFLPPALNYEMHRFLAWMALITVIGHFASFTFDEYFHLTFFEGLIPFAIMRDFPSQLGFDLRWAIGIGTIAFYGIAALIISSELKGRFLSLKKWRALHYSSFLTYLMFLAHGFFSGSDSSRWWMLWLYGASATMVLSLTGLRIYAAIQKKKSLVIAAQETPSLKIERFN